MIATSYLGPLKLLKVKKRVAAVGMPGNERKRNGEKEMCIFFKKEPKSHHMR